MENKFNIEKSRTHVVKRESGWAIKKEGMKRALKTYKTKEEAIKDAKKTKNDESVLIIHKKDGSIQKWLQ
jgi:hypothetical protein